MHRLPTAVRHALLLISLLVGAAAAGADDRPVEAVLERLEGGRVKLAELRGTPVLLELWATWCAPCVEQAEILHALGPELAERRVSVLAVDVGEERSVVEAFVAGRAGTFPVLLDRRQVVPRQVDIGELPALVLLDADGRVAGVRLGLTGREEVLAMLELAP